MLFSIIPRVFGKGRVAFVPLLDASGSTQLVCDTGKWGSVLDSLRTESVVRATGRVEPRPTKDVNAQQPSGEVEVHLSSLEVLNTADPELPFRPSEVKAASVSACAAYQLVSVRKNDIVSSIHSLIRIICVVTM